MRSTSLIKRWSPKHEIAVALHLSGKSNTEIAEAIGMKPVRISQIINDPKGQKLIAEGQKLIRLRMQESISHRVLEMAEIGTRRLMDTFEAEFPLGTEAKKHQDNKVIDILKGTGFLSTTFQNETDNTGSVTNAVAKSLTDAIHKATQAERYKEDIPTADFEIISDD